MPRFIHSVDVPLCLVLAPHSRFIVNVEQIRDAAGSEIELASVVFPLFSRVSFAPVFGKPRSSPNLRYSGINISSELFFHQDVFESKWERTAFIRFPQEIVSMRSLLFRLTLSYIVCSFEIDDWLSYFELPSSTVSLLLYPGLNFPSSWIS